MHQFSTAGFRILKFLQKVAGQENSLEISEVTKFPRIPICLIIGVCCPPNWRHWSKFFADELQEGKSKMQNARFQNQNKVA